MKEMQANVVACLNEVPHKQILQYANHSARFMDSYIQGLNGAQAAWANRRYHGHWTLPPEMAAKARLALP
ncbi:hypothetical protein F5146DRAFT_1061075 [Armillaria mellea]|nr:hypothetical protein F5146DRAFT_1061075 [Armillaria mellea]